MRTFLVALLASLPLVACTVGADGGGQGSNDSDYTFCRPTPIDSNADGIPDGLDLNCDGKIDIPYGGGGSNGGSSGGHDSCSTMTSVNGVTKSVSCEGNGTTATCECRIGGNLVETCTQASASCSIGVPNGNCCGF